MEENKRYQQKTYNKPAAGYNVPGKGDGGASPLAGEPSKLSGDGGLSGIPAALPDESLSSLQSQAEKNYDKLK